MWPKIGGAYRLTHPSQVLWLLILLLALTLFGCSPQNNGASQRVERDSVLILSTNAYKGEAASNYETIVSDDIVLFNAGSESLWNKLADTLKSKSADFYKQIEKGYTREEFRDYKLDRSDYIATFSYYLDEILSFEPEIGAVFKENFNRILRQIQDIKYQELSDLQFLDKIQNAASYTEYVVSKFLLLKSKPGCNLRFTKTRLLIGQNARVLNPSDELTVIAGVGSFSRAAAPQFEINGKKIDINNRDLAQYSMRVSSTPGRYSLPVIVRYIDSDGITQLDTLKIDYEVK